MLPLVALGCLVHLATLSSEPDQHAIKIVGVQIAAFVALVLSSANLGLLHALAFALKVGGAFHLGLWTSVILHRCLFHRLRCFPGPWLHLEIEGLHQQYGDFVRVGPRELSIKRQSAVAAVYGSKSMCTKGPWYSSISNDPNYVSLHACRNDAEHLRRRRAWDRGLSHAAIKSYIPRMAEKATRLIEQLRKRSSTNSQVDVTDWAMRVAFDVMGDCGLGKDFNALSDGPPHPAIRGLHDTMKDISLFGTVNWTLGILAAIPGGAPGFVTFGNYCTDQVAEKKKILDKKSSPQDILSWLITAQWTGDKSAPPETAFTEDARLLIVAGSDTSASVITNALYYLARNPTYQDRLADVLVQHFPGGDDDWDPERLAIPLLDDIIHETLRLSPSVPGGLQRVTPPEGITIDEVHIPGNTVVSVPSWSIQRDPRYWEDADVFRPERWSEEGLNPETAPAFVAFTKGTYACAGKAFARQELRMVLSKIVLNFSFKFADTENANKASSVDVLRRILLPSRLKLDE
ncbi:cytochrome P450 67 [Flagelloscypha sp. PMI_526]|nr:cytochrome P450 67 [Flagelloscypha sp. PMI_526]